MTGYENTGRPWPPLLVIAFSFQKCYCIKVSPMFISEDWALGPHAAFQSRALAKNTRGCGTNRNWESELLRTWYSYVESIFLRHIHIWVKNHETICCAASSVEDPSTCLRSQCNIITISKIPIEESSPQNVYTVKPVCNDHLYKKLLSCDLFSNVF